MQKLLLGRYSLKSVARAILPSKLATGVMGDLDQIDANATQIHFAPRPAILSLKSEDEPGHVNRVSLKELVEERCKSLYSPFQTIPWLFNGHFQTLYSVVGNFSAVDRVWYRRTFLRLVDGGTLGLDFAPADQAMVKDDAPILVVAHGLTGGSHESYVRAIVAPACMAVEKGGLGYRAVVVNFRGCAGVPVTSPQLYSGGNTDDLRQALLYITHKYPEAPLLGLGFSMGANVLTKYVAEEGKSCRLSSACIISCPWNLEANRQGLANSFFGRNVYSRGLGNNLKKLITHHEQSFRKFPDHKICDAVAAVSKLRSYPTFPEIDNAFTKEVGGTSPPFPFPSVLDYYRWASSDSVLEKIKVPFLAINSADDPVVTAVPMDGKGNEMVVMVLTKQGGHLGWFKDWKERWTTKPVIDWLGVMGKGVVHNYCEGLRTISVDGEGFLREEGRECLGCKDIEGGGLIDGSTYKEELLAGL